MQYQQTTIADERRNTLDAVARARQAERRLAALEGEMQAREGELEQSQRALLATKSQAFASSRQLSRLSGMAARRSWRLAFRLLVQRHWVYWKRRVHSLRLEENERLRAAANDLLRQTTAWEEELLQRQALSAVPPSPPAPVERQVPDTAGYRSLGYDTRAALSRVRGRGAHGTDSTGTGGQLRRN
jgi:hypothetical protein